MSLDLGGPEAVAFRLMEKIMAEELNIGTVSNPREHILKLYGQCLQIVQNRGTRAATPS